MKFIKIFDTIMEAKFGQIAWKHDEHGNYDGIFYSVDIIFKLFTFLNIKYIL